PGRIVETTVGVEAWTGILVFTSFPNPARYCTRTLNQGALSAMV
ncbi:MAG: hypothetical protein ACI9I0_001924, partial [Rhodoferax sp.]